jgi:hypothetical protein
MDRYNLISILGEKKNMSTLRRILTGAALAALAVGMASADTVSFTNTIGPTATDLTDATLTLPSWDPGVTPGTLAPGYTYTLNSFDIVVTSNLSGNFTLENLPDASSDTTGTAQAQSYTAVAIGSPLAPPLSVTQDPANDIFNIGPGNLGPTNISSSYNVGDLAPGDTFTSPTFDLTSSADLGCELATNSACGAFFANLFPVTTSLGQVEAPPDPLTLYISTVTADALITVGGNNQTTFNTDATETATIYYNFTATPLSSTPEPATMLLFGSALVGLGCIRKRIRK